MTAVLTAGREGYKRPSLLPFPLFLITIRRGLNTKAEGVTLMREEAGRPKTGSVGDHVLSFLWREVPNVG